MIAELPVLIEIAIGGLGLLALVRHLLGRREDEIDAAWRNAARRLSLDWRPPLHVSQYEISGYLRGVRVLVQVVDRGDSDSSDLRTRVEARSDRIPFDLEIGSETT